MGEVLQDGSLRVVFAGGGSGGHLMPGAATAEALRLLLPRSRSLFLITEGRAENQYVWVTTYGLSAQAAEYRCADYEALAGVV